MVITSRKDLSIAQREWKKKKAQKKAQRLKQMEDEREQDKNKWVQFNAKVCHCLFLHNIITVIICYYDPLMVVFHVCLSVSLQEHSKSYESIMMNFFA